MLASILGHLQPKVYQIHHPITDTVTPAQHSATPLSGWGSYDYKKLAHSSRAAELHNSTEILQKVALQKRQGTESENAYSCSITDTFGCHLWKATAPESSNRGSPKLGLEVWRIRTIDGRPRPLLEVYTNGASTSNYICHPNIHYLLSFKNCTSRTVIISWCKITCHGQLITITDNSSNWPCLPWHSARIGC